MFTGTSCFSAPVDSLDQVSVVEIRLSNDLFQLKHKSDKHFSAGFFLAVAHEVFDNKFSNFILLGSKNDPGSYGVFVSQKGFTPQDLSLEQIDYTDRPYCGTLTAHIWRESSSTYRKMNYISFLKVGLSGPPSMVAEVQHGIHKWTDSTIPMGWGNQIGTSLILDYFLKARKTFLPYNGWFQLGTSLEAEVGTFIGRTAGEAGIQLGWFNNELLHHRGLVAKGGCSQRKWQAFLKAEMRESYVFYDGTLQGGLLPFSSSPYTLSYGDYNHLITLFTYKMIFSYDRFLLCYRKSLEVGHFEANDLFGFGTFDIVFPF